MIILGINAYHADASAALLVDGLLVSAAEEERFKRMKHWAGMPAQAVQYCLNEAGLKLEDVDHIAVSRNPRAHFVRKVFYSLAHRPGFGYLKDRVRNLSKIRDVKRTLAQTVGIDRNCVKAPVHHVEHHRSHMASAFFVSEFDDSAVMSVDALGDYVSTMRAHGTGNHMRVLGSVLFPHSLGFLYTAGTQYLGFPKYGDEYKVMGLASYGKPGYVELFRRMIRMKSRAKFELNLDFFRHHRDGVSMSWESGEPVIGPLFSEEWIKALGPRREPGSELTSRHEDIASSLQAVFEEVYFALLNDLYEELRVKRLCLAGGCAMNSVANGKIFDRTSFEEVFIQPAAGDAGTAIGAAFYVYHQVLGRPRRFVMKHAYWGPSFGHSEIEALIGESNHDGGQGGLNNGWRVTVVGEELELCRKAARAIADGKVVGWFQGRMELGARALGNRSILADPRRSGMKAILNERIKRRESFRPFAPSITVDDVGQYFEKIYPDPFMIKVYPVREEKRSAIPAVTHVDGSGRLQTVSQAENPLYWRLIKEFEKLTGVPVVLNTSFNENEPIVCRPEEALDCFKRTKMDVLVLGNFVLEKT